MEEQPIQGKDAQVLDAPTYKGPIELIQEADGSFVAVIHTQERNPLILARWPVNGPQVPIVEAGKMPRMAQLPE